MHKSAEHSFRSRDHPAIDDHDVVACKITAPQRCNALVQGFGAAAVIGVPKFPEQMREPHRVFGIENEVAVPDLTGGTAIFEDLAQGLVDGRAVSRTLDRGQGTNHGKGRRGRGRRDNPQ